MRKAQKIGQARNLRRNLTDAEKLLWFHLRDRRLQDLKFRRQQPIGPYIVDFICVDKKLVVELDGGQHTERRIYDRKRTEFLQMQGFTVMRFWNNEVLGQTEAVLHMIVNACGFSNSPHHNPLPLAGEGGAVASSDPI